MSEMNLPDDEKMNGGSPSGSCSVCQVHLRRLSPHPFYRCTHWHREAKKLPRVTQWRLVCLKLTPKPFVTNLYRDHEIARVGRGFPGSLVHRKCELGRRVRKNLGFCTG